ncbi:MAG: hypothetical protein ABSD74_05615 [Rhizomicrobium sp.]|jgi:hypothetical protein
MTESTSPAEPTVPTIRLAGRELPIPVLAPRQNRTIVPALLDLIPKVIEARSCALVDPQDESKGINRLRLLTHLIDTSTYDAMCDIVFTAMTRAQPDFKRIEFDDLSLDIEDLIAAIFVVARQSGVIRN